jgi:hypothetical protein
VLPDEHYGDTQGEVEMASGDAEAEIHQTGPDDGARDGTARPEEPESVEARVGGAGASAKDAQVEGSDDLKHKVHSDGNAKSSRRDTAEMRRRRAHRLMLGLAGAVLLMTLSLGFFLVMQKPAARQGNEEKLSAKQEVLGSEPSSRKRYKLERQSPVDQKLSTMEGLIRALKDKEATLSNVIKHYQAGIRAVENEIREDIAGGGLETYQDARKAKKIELRLLTIQRRLIYIEALERLIQQVVVDCEALIYAKREIEIDMQMLDIIQGMTPHQLATRMDSIIQQHLHDADKFEMDTRGVKPQALEKIWERIHAKQGAPGLRGPTVSGEASANEEIWREICEGNFDRKHELTTLPPTVAKCLSEWKGKDLFLSKLTHLSPEAAKHLAQWNGRWLSLNGLSELSPEAARYLSEWQGSRLSLNGLKEVSPEVVVSLYQWHGDELELVSLNNINRWDKSGKKVHLADRYTRK